MIGYSACIVIYSYTRSQQDAVFPNSIFNLVYNSTRYISNSLSVNITSMTNTNCCEYGIKAPDDGQYICPKHAELYHHHQP
jgi:hypothetical protein